MKLHGKDKMMILNREDHTAFHLPNVYRVIDHEESNEFIAKIRNPKTLKLSNRRFNKQKYAYSIEKDPLWVPSTVRKSNAGI